MALPLMIWPYRMARIGERWEGIGSKREWNEIEPTDWKVTYTRMSGVFILLIALTLLAI